EFCWEFPFFSKDIPARCANISNASLKLTRSCSMTKLITSPFFPHAQQRKFCQRGSTSKEGRESSWKGHRPLNLAPAGRRATEAPTISTMSLASFTRRMRSVESSAKGHLAEQEIRKGTAAVSRGRSVQSCTPAEETGVRALRKYCQKETSPLLP